MMYLANLCILFLFFTFIANVTAFVSTASKISGASLAMRQHEVDHSKSALHAFDLLADASSSSIASLSDYASAADGVVAVGEADQAFRLGVQLEKSGKARAAWDAFHEAATLFQCFLENSSQFRHVTALDERDCRAILSYCCIRLAHLNHDALGDPFAATRLYKDASTIDPYPSSCSYDGIGTSMEASGEYSLEDAVNAYKEALRITPNNGLVQFHLAVALERMGDEKSVEEASELFEQLRRGEATVACLVDSWGYVRWHTRKNLGANLHRGTRAMLQLALEAAAPLIRNGGLVCEFGVASGRSIRMTQELLPLNIPIHGFDTFHGLPQKWGNEPVGSYSTGGMIPVMEGGNVFFHKGLFIDTIPRFLADNAADGAPLAYANIDCDLYSSTLDILEAFHSRIVPGTILVFDEYLCHPTWRQDEFRAWRECCKRFGWHYEYLGFSLSTKQSVVRVTGN